ncbi:MAG: hypothetical protein NC548_37885 [Lachnospiraceae bacterium]|nr:hypothetical protein [Lachnospiraceae bacterium]MCM1231184.1 hypothetical protein [Ruminococcus flavefaciens]
MAKPNRDIDDLNNSATAGKLGAGVLIGGGVILAGRKISKSAKKRRLQDELQDVRSELSKYRGGLFKETWYYAKIQSLEEREAELVEEINNL